MLGRKPKTIGRRPALKKRVILGKPAVVPVKPVHVGPFIPRKPQPRAYYKKHKEGVRVDYMIPFRHVEAPFIYNSKLHAYWERDARSGDMIVAVDDVFPVQHNNNEIVPVHPYLVGKDQIRRIQRDLVSQALPVQKDTYGIFAGKVRVIERDENKSDIVVIRYTAIFPSGRYVLADLNYFAPITLYAPQ